MTPSETEAAEWDMLLDQRRQLEAWHRELDREIKLEKELAKLRGRPALLSAKMRAYARFKTSGGDPSHSFELAITAGLFAFVNALDLALAKAFVSRSRSLRQAEIVGFLSEAEEIGERLIAAGVSGEPDAEPLTGGLLKEPDRTQIRNLLRLDAPPVPEGGAKRSKPVVKPDPAPVTAVTAETVMAPDLSGIIEWMEDEPEKPTAVAPAP